LRKYLRGLRVRKMSQRTDKFSIILGRNYIETLLLTLTQFEIAYPNIQEYIVKRLQYEIEGLSLSYPSILKIYHKNVIKRFKDTYQDIPVPELRSFDVYDQIVEHLKKYKSKILPKRASIHPEEAEKKIREVACRIIRSAIHATLYETGIIKVSA